MSIYQVLVDIPTNTSSPKVVPALPGIHSLSEFSRLTRRGFGDFLVEGLIEKKCFLLVDANICRTALQKIREQVLGFFDNELIFEQMWTDGSLIVVVIHDSVKSPVCCRMFPGVTCVCVPDIAGANSLTHELTHSVLRTGNRFFDEGLALYLEYLFHKKFPKFFADDFSVESFPNEHDVYVSFELSTRYSNAGKYFELPTGSVDRVAYQYALGLVASLVKKVGLKPMYRHLQDAVRHGQYIGLSYVLLGKTAPEKDTRQYLEVRTTECRSLWLQCRRELASSSQLDECVRRLAVRLDLDLLNRKELEWLVKLVAQRMLVASYTSGGFSLEDERVYDLALSSLAKGKSGEALCAHAQMQTAVARLIVGRSGELGEEDEIGRLLANALSVRPLCPSVKIDAAALQHYMNRYDSETNSRVRALLSSAEGDPTFGGEVSRYREHLGL